MAGKKLHKSNKSKMFCGVCGGFAEYFNIDVTIIRLIFIVIGLLRGVGLLFYILCAILIPNDLEVEYEIKDEEEKSTEEIESKNKNLPHSDEEFDSIFKNSNSN